MRLRVSWLPLLLFGAVLLSQTEARRVRIQHVQEPDEEETIQYYAAEPQDEEEERAPRQRVVLVSTADQYNGLYGQPTAASRSSHDNYIPSSRKSLAALRSKESPKAPPVQTIRNYNKVNDDGSFTFGYEAADGSFKEETRGTDCVVRGKYGYIDPDGNKREFTYVSGNPCDPNAPKEEAEAEQEQENEPENVPANYPIRPIRPRPVTIAPKPAVTLFQNTYDQSEEEQPEPEQVLKQQQPIRRPTYISRPQYVQQTATEEAQVYQRPQIIPATTPTSLLYNKQSISITPRPASPTPSTRAQLPATTYRPQLLQVAVTPRPSLLYATKQLSSPSSTAIPSRANVDFDAEFQKFQQENNILAPTPSPKTVTTVAKTSKPVTTTSPGTNPVYSSALIFDPTSGQYNTQLYQTLPQTEGDISLTQRIQPYVQQPPRHLLNLQQLQRQSPLYAHVRPTATQEAYQQQQAGLQFHNSAQLYAQQRARLQQQQQQQQQPQQQQQQQQQRPVQSQPVYYIQPSADQPLVSGQIDAFLRGHNIQF